MVRRSFTAVLEKNARFHSDFATEPYEAAWASEARWFVRVMEMSAGVVLRVRPQISPDGLNWCDEGTPAATITQTGLYSFALENFGQWLRLDGAVRGESPNVRVMIYLALKE